MIKYIILSLFINLNYVFSDLNKEEGADCEWDGIKGQCVKETRCMTTLDTKSPQPPVCSTKGVDKIVCCTDCDLVNDTRTAVFSPRTGIYFKDGSKARDNCLQYIKDLPYQCKSGGFYSGIKRQLNKEKNCHVFGLWGIGGAPAHGEEPGAQYPHQVLLGYGDTLETTKWLAGGSLISDKFILTAAHVVKFKDDAPLTFVALDVKNRSESPSTWQTQKIKRFITAPEYKQPQKYHDIALIETEMPVTFNRNVLPACLHIEDAKDDQAVATTWRNLETKDNSHGLVDTIQTIHVEKFSKEECEAAYGTFRHLPRGVDVNTQLCYGSKTHSPESCRGLSGEPLLIDTQLDTCAYAVIGVTSFGAACGPQSVKPDVYTKVKPYVSWIESVVWP